MRVFNSAVLYTACDLFVKYRFDAFHAVARIHMGYTGKIYKSEQEPAEEIRRFPPQVLVCRTGIPLVAPSVPLRVFTWDNWEFDISRCSPATYGTAVRNLRMDRKITQSTFAGQIGTSTATLSKIEAGKSPKINPDLMYNICGIYNVTPGYLMGQTSLPEGYVEIDPSTAKEILKIRDHPLFPDVVGNLCEALQLPYKIDNWELINKHYQERPELCELMLWVLQSENSKLKETVTSFLRFLVQFFEDRSGYNG